MSDRYINIRIPVCVAANGDWNAVSWRGGMESGDDVQQAMDPMESCGSPTHVVYVTARVPRPMDPEPVEGQVDDA